MIPTIFVRGSFRIYIGTCETTGKKQAMIKYKFEYEIMGVIIKQSSHRNKQSKLFGGGERGRNICREKFVR